MRSLSIGFMWLVLLTSVAPAAAQVSSIGARRRAELEAHPPKAKPREAVRSRRNAIYDKYSWTAIPGTSPKAFRVHDLITIVVRQRSKYEADSDSAQEKKWNLKSDLEAFIKLTQGGIGASPFRRGKPSIDYKSLNKLEGTGQLDREDKLTTRLTVEIIDIKPNGNLVVQGRSHLRWDDEVSYITLTGTCRKEDVTADNTILSTQLADLNIDSSNEGALRRATMRGWLPRLIDWINPI